MVDVIVISSALLCLFSIIKLTNSQITDAGSATNDTLEPEDIQLQWCGHGKAPELIDFNTSGITEEQRNISARLVNGSVSCFPEMTTSLYTLDLNRRFNSTHQDLSFDQELSITGYFRLGNIYYPPDKYCIANWTESSVTVQVCAAVPECGVSTPCVPMCCARNSPLLTGTKSPCLTSFENPKLFSPTLYTTVWEKSLKTPAYYIKSCIERRCGTGLTTAIHETHPLNEVNSKAVRRCFRILEDGTLRMLDSKRNWIQIARDDYCLQLEGFPTKGTSRNHPVENFLGEEQHYSALICTNATRRYEDPMYTTTLPLIYGAAFIVASIFILLTLSVHVLLWNEQKIHGWATMCHLGTMFLFYVFLGIDNILEAQDMAVKDETAGVPFLCMASGIFLHFLFLSNFCWLTVICFHIFWVFRIHSYWSHNPKRFRAYVAFGWGSPFVYVMVSVVLDQKYSYEPCNEVLVPMYGRETCSIASAAQGPYLYYPIAVLLVMNMIFFTNTCWELYTAKYGIARENQAKSVEFRALLQLFAKLFFLMGFPLILEIVFWNVSGSKDIWYWVIVEVLTILQEIAIFVIYICKPNIITSLQKNHPKLTTLLGLLFKDKFIGKSVHIREAETSNGHIRSISSNDKIANMTSETTFQRCQFPIL